MAFKNYNIADNAFSTLLTGISASDTTIELESGDGDKFPSSNFILTLVQYETTGDESTTVQQSEKVLCVSRTDDTLTVTRGFDGDSPLDFEAGDNVYLNVVAKITEDIQDEVTRLENDKLDTSTYNSSTRDNLTAYRLLYIDGNGEETELSLGSAGQVLVSQGTTSNPVWESPTVNIGGLDETTEVEVDDEFILHRPGEGNLKIKGSKGLGLGIGDILQTSRTLTAPKYELCDGRFFDEGIYPLLDAILGLSGLGDFAKLSNPDALPTGRGLGTAFSPDGIYLSVAHMDSPYITIYKRDGDTFTKLDDPNILPTGNGTGTAFSSDGTYLAVAHLDSPYVTIYKRDGDTFTKLDDPNILPTGNGLGTAFSPDGTYLSVGHRESPYITIYKRDGDVFTKLGNPSTLPAGESRGTAFSPDGTYLSVPHDFSPYITIYKRDGDTFTKLDDPTTLPTGRGNATAFSPDGTYLSVAQLDSPYVTIYKRDGDVFTKLDDPDTLPTGNGWGTAFSPDGTYLAVAHLDSPYVTIYKRDGDTFTKLDDPNILPTGNGLGTAFSPDWTYLSVAHDNSPYITTYKQSVGLSLPNLPTDDNRIGNYIKTGE